MNTRLTGVAFDSDAVQAMTTAHDEACRSLGIVDRAGDHRSEILARMIVEYAQRGERDPQQLCEQALATLRTY